MMEVVKVDLPVVVEEEVELDSPDVIAEAEVDSADVAEEVVEEKIKEEVMVRSYAIT